MWRMQQYRPQSEQASVLMCVCMKFGREEHCQASVVAFWSPLGLHLALGFVKIIHDSLS